MVEGLAVLQAADAGKQLGGEERGKRSDGVHGGGKQTVAFDVNPERGDTPVRQQPVRDLRECEDDQNDRGFAP